MANISMSIARNPVSTKLESGYVAGSIYRVSGSGFGSGPAKIDFWHRVSGSDLALVSADDPEIGTYAYLTNQTTEKSRYSVVGGKAYMCARDPSLVSSSTKYQTDAYFNITPTTEFFAFRRLYSDPARIMIGASVAGGDVSGLGSYWKDFWCTDPNNSTAPPYIGYADIVMGTWVGGECKIDGNTNSAVKATGSNYFYPKINGSVMPGGGHVGRGYYQSGRESSPGAKDALISLMQISSDGASFNTALGDPYSPKETINNFNYFQINWSSYFGQLPVGSDHTNVQGLGDYFYVATGSNCRATIFAGNNSVFANCTNLLPIANSSWSDTDIYFAPNAYEKAQGFWHLMLGDGTVINNITAVPTT